MSPHKPPQNSLIHKVCVVGRNDKPTTPTPKNGSRGGGPVAEVEPAPPAGPSPGEQLSPVHRDVLGPATQVDHQVLVPVFQDPERPIVRGLQGASVRVVPDEHVPCRAELHGNPGHLSSVPSSGDRSKGLSGAVADQGTDALGRKSPGTLNGCP